MAGNRKIKNKNKFLNKTYSFVQQYQLTRTGEELFYQNMMLQNVPL
jgi:hypothetical protein